MRNLVVLGAGTAGTIVATRLRRKLAERDWRITVVDRDDAHLYQPGLLLLPFGAYQPEDLVKRRRSFLPPQVEFVVAEIDSIRADSNVVALADGRELPYDALVIASGTTPRPDQTPGLLGDEWRTSTSSTCRSSARWRRWSSPSSPTRSSRSVACGIRSTSRS
jgi:sulfide:quinone oxidoreductase